MRKRLTCVVIVAGGFAAVPAESRATQIAYEGFDYATPGGLFGKNGGSGFGSNAWAQINTDGEPALAAGSLPYSDGTNSIETSGNKLGQALNTRASRNLDAVEAVANRTIWVSFRANYTGGSTFPTNHAGFSLFSGANATGSEFFLGKPGSATHWGVDTSSATAAQASGTPSASQLDAFLLTKITYGASSATVQMWIDPVLDESSLGAAPINSTQTNFTIASIRVSTGSNASNFQFDEFRMADTFAEVVPEPGAASLGAVAAAGLLASRRRRAS